MSLLFGVKSETTGDNGKPKRSMDGIRSFIPSGNVTIFSSVATVSLLLDAFSPMFNYESAGGDERIVFCGNEALNVINKIIQIDGGTQMQFGDTITQFGMNLTKMVIPQGTLYFRRHPLLSRNTLYNKSLWIIDFSSLRWRHMPGRDTHFEDNIQGNDEDTQKGQWLTEGGLEVRYGGLTNGYIGNMQI